ncbi:MAG: glycerophosphodiester phosphodiesterase family protein [Verrucomicrobia bacterium]|nr:glycerophosphodiester phosphodiesterase family protein [Verrucomicrobiota bacterium]
MKLCRLVLFLWLAGVCSGAPRHAPDLLGYVRGVPPESAPAREARHRKVAERRAGPVIIVHRGAWAFAPENTLEAYAAAMDYGADGCEVDVRRTADGVLVLFHDDMLDRLTDGLGAVNQITYYELLALRPQLRQGTATRQTRPPTFAALLILARQRAMLLHLDIKEPGLEEELARLLDEADLWDHVVAVNTANAPKLLQHPKLKLLAYKTGLYEGRRDVDPPSVREALTTPGQMLIVDDPRVVARELGRPAYRPVPLPGGLREFYSLGITYTSADYPVLVPMAHVRRLSFRINFRSVKDLLGLLGGDDLHERTQPEGSEAYQRRRTERIVERAWAAQRLGQRGRRSARAVERLEFQVRHRSLHRDWKYHGLDGALATRALAELGATGSAPVLIEAFRRIDPELKTVASPEFRQYPLAWTDWRAKMYILAALGELRTEAAKRFLLEYLALDEIAARELGPPQFEEATRALLRHHLNRAELEALLRSRHSAVRGTAILEFLDHPTKERTAALRALAPWALELPRARGR